MTATHTPGPWAVNPIPGEPGWFEVVAPKTLHAGKPWRIATDLTAGNAQLTVAGPDLLANAEKALAEIHDARTAMREKAAGINPDEMLATAGAYLQRAIAKARGGA